MLGWGLGERPHTFLQAILPLDLEASERRSTCATDCSAPTAPLLAHCQSSDSLRHRGHSSAAATGAVALEKRQPTFGTTTRRDGTAGGDAAGREEPAERAAPSLARQP